MDCTQQRSHQPVGRYRACRTTRVLHVQRTVQFHSLTQQAVSLCLFHHKQPWSLSSWAAAHWWRSMFEDLLWMNQDIHHAQSEVCVGHFNFSTSKAQHVECYPPGSHCFPFMSSGLCMEPPHHSRGSKSVVTFVVWLTYALIRDSIREHLTLDIVQHLRNIFIWKYWKTIDLVFVILISKVCNTEQYQNFDALPYSISGHLFWNWGPACEVGGQFRHIWENDRWYWSLTL